MGYGKTIEELTARIDEFKIMFPGQKFKISKKETIMRYFPKRGFNTVCFGHNRTRCKHCPKRCCTKDVPCEAHSLAVLNPNNVMSEWDFTLNILDPYRLNPGSYNYAIWQCEKGHIWCSQICTRVGNRKNGRACGCIKCNTWMSHQNASNVTEFWDYSKNTGYMEDRTVFDKVWLKCSKGHSWICPINSRLNNCNNCFTCEGQSAAIKLSEEALRQWSPKNKFTPHQYRPNCRESVLWICPKGHDYEAIIANMTRNKIKEGCFLCKSLKMNDPLGLCESWDYEKNDLGPESYSPGSEQKVYWICEEGHSFQARICNRSYGSGCPKCNLSGGAKQILKFFRAFECEPDIEKVFDDCKRDAHLRFDFFIEEIGMCIEFDGCQHFDPNHPFFKGTKNRFKIQEECDLIKTQYCLDNGYSLIRIPYNRIKSIFVLLSLCCGMLKKNMVIYNFGFVEDEEIYAKHHNLVKKFYFTETDNEIQYFRPFYSKLFEASLDKVLDAITFKTVLNEIKNLHNI
jgi:hypothetical protein